MSAASWPERLVSPVRSPRSVLELGPDSTSAVAD